MNKKTYSKAKIKQLAEENIRFFTSDIKRLLVIENMNFDLILACGNTGIYLAELTKWIFNELKIKHPLVLKLPIQRFCKSEAQKWPDSKMEAKRLRYQINPAKNFPLVIFDNSVLLPELKKQIFGQKKYKNILFVDDEIHSTLTIRLALDLLQKSGHLSNQPNVTIVAENHNLIWPYHNPDVFLHFLPFGIHKQLNNLISNAVSSDFIGSVLQYLPEDFNKKSVVNLLLDLPVKVFNGKKPNFTKQFNLKLRKEMTEYDVQKKEHKKYLMKLIHEGLAQK